MKLRKWTVNKGKTFKTTWGPVLVQDIVELDGLAAVKFRTYASTIRIVEASKFGRNILAELTDKDL